LGRSNAPQRARVLRLPNALSTITSGIRTFARATQGAVNKTKIKNN
jgi:hypothetical protein